MVIAASIAAGRGGQAYRDGRPHLERTIRHQRGVRPCRTGAGGSHWRPELDHDEWYVYADEWIEILDRLWSEPDIFDYAGRFFKLKGAGSYPKPLQQPRPANHERGELGRWPALGGAPLGHDVHLRATATIGHQAKVDHIRMLASTAAT